MYTKILKVVLDLLVHHVTPSNVFRRIPRSEALVLQIIFFSEQPFYGFKLKIFLKMENERIKTGQKILMNKTSTKLLLFGN